MKKLITSISFLFLLFIALSGCEDFTDLTEPQINLGSANFARFVSIGNSLTMGEQSSSVFESAQMYSIGNIIANQVGAAYAQATFSEPGTAGRLEVEKLEPFTLYTNTNQGSPSNLNYPAPYNNLGIKGAFLYDVLNARDASSCYTANPPFNSPNPLFDAVLRGLGTQLELAVAQQPTFMTLWIGNNDILAYATRGGLFPPTDPAVFQDQYTQVLTTLNATGAQIIIGGMPNALLTPYFRTVGPGVGLSLQRNQLPGIVFSKTDGSTGQASVQDLFAYNVLVLLTASSAVGYIGDVTGAYYTDNNITVPPGVNTAFPFGLAAENPFPNNLVLDQSEMANYEALRNGYNQIITGLAASFEYAVINWDNLFNSLATTGLLVNGVEFSATFVSGNFFSLDGIHPTSQGYAIVANEFIKSINAKYNAAIPLVDVSTIPGSLILADRISMGKYGIPTIPFGSLDNVLF